MSEQQRIDDLITRGTDHQIKFVYGMISLALGTLALSFQFSTKHQLHPSILILSWIVLFVSILLGGWRIYILPSVFFLNANMLNNPKFYQKGANKIEDISSKAKWVYKLQIILLLWGLFLLGLFTTLNYLKSLN